MGDEMDNAQDLVESLREETRGARTRKRGFFAWHKPRKQFVRTQQWTRHLRLLIESNVAAWHDRPVSYLGLPGDDMLDLREFHDLCDEFNIDLRYLGLNAVSKERSAESDLSHAELRSQAYLRIDPIRSELLLDSLEALGRSKSVAHQRAVELAPYDVVNFDLCDCLGKVEPGAIDSVINALRAVLEIQRRKTTSSWLLFLTTRTDMSHVHNDTWRILSERIIKNADASDEFAAAYRVCVGKDAQSQASLAKEAFGRAFVIGFFKWLLHAAGEPASPAWSSELVDSAGYRVHRGLDMYSLVFKMDMNVVAGADHDGWSSTDALGELVRVNRSQHSEVGSAIRAVEKVRSSINVDEQLVQDDALKAELVDKASRLMSAARYDGEEYRRWVANGCRRHK